MFDTLLLLFKRRRKVEEPKPQPKVFSVMDDIELLRARIKGVGWNLLEIPINGGARGFRVVASRKDRTVSADGTTLHDSLQKLGLALGVR